MEVSAAPDLADQRLPEEFEPPDTEESGSSFGHDTTDSDDIPDGADCRLEKTSGYKNS